MNDIAERIAARLAAIERRLQHITWIAFCILLALVARLF